jgi:hypothetical protein
MGYMKDLKEEMRDARRGRSGQFARIKSMFFDRQAVKNMMDKRSREVLSHFGALCMRIARNSIRSSDSISSPGSPPSSHVGMENRRIRARAKAAGHHRPKLSTGIKEIYYSYDPSSNSVVIGPVPFNSSELSATAGSRGSNLTTLELLEYGGTAYRRVKQVEFAGEKYFITHPGFPPVRCEYKARPFMGPAFDKAEEQLPAMWADSVK